MINIMKGYSEEVNNNWCNFHPTEVIVGVCPLCLKERLISLLASSSSKHGHRPARRSRSRRSHHIYVLQKVSALGSFLRRSSSSRRQSRLDLDLTDDDTSSGQEDSFISIKFGDDGCASWDKMSKDHSKPSSVQDSNLKLFPSSNYNLKENLYSTSTGLKKTSTTTSSCSSVVEHNKGPRGGALRWRKRIGQVLFQFARLKRSTMEGSCHVSTTGKVVKGLNTRKSWIKTLTKRRDHG